MGAAMRILNGDGPLELGGVTVLRLTGRWRPGQAPLHALPDTVRRLLKNGALALVVDTSRLDASNDGDYVEQLVAAFEIAREGEVDLALVLNDSQRAELDKSRPRIPVLCYSSIEEAVGELGELRPFPLPGDPGEGSGQL